MFILFGTKDRAVVTDEWKETERAPCLKKYFLLSFHS